MKSLFVRRYTFVMLLMSGSCLLFSCGLTQRDYTNIAQTALTTASTSILQSILSNLAAAGG